MTIYYVRPDGNNLNTGLGSGTDQAFATISKAASVMLAAGDKAITAPGDYRELVVTAAAGVIFEADHLALNFPNVAPGGVRVTGFDTDSSYSVPQRFNAFKIAHENVQIVGKWYFDGFKNGTTNADKAVVYITGKTPLVRGITIRQALGRGIHHDSADATVNDYDRTIIELCDVETFEQAIMAGTSSGVTVQDNRLFSRSTAIAIGYKAAKVLRNNVEVEPSAAVYSISLYDSAASNAPRAFICGNIITHGNPATPALTITCSSSVADQGPFIAGNLILKGGLLVWDIRPTTQTNGLAEICGNEMLFTTSTLPWLIDPVSTPGTGNKLRYRKNRFMNAGTANPWTTSGALDILVEDNEFLYWQAFAYSPGSHTWTWNRNRWAGLAQASTLPVDPGALWGIPETLEPICRPTVEIATPISGSKSLKLPVWYSNLGGGQNVIRIPADLGDVTVRLKAKKTFLGGSVTFEINNGQAGKPIVSMADNTDVQILDITGYQGANGYLELRICAEAPSLNTGGTDAVLVDDIEIV